MIPISTSPRVETVATHRATFVLLAALFAAGIAFCVWYFAATRPMTAMLSQPEGEMDWLRVEFHLSDAQFSKIKAMHEAYRPTCDQMCARIAEANSRLDQLLDQSKSVTPEIEAALKQCAAVQEECHQAMLGHIYAVSAEMNPKDGQRYFQLMKTRIVTPGLPHDTVVVKTQK